MCHLASAESKAYANLISFAQELFRPVRLGLKIMSIDAAGKLNFFYFNRLLFFIRFLVALVALVTVLTVIH